MADGPLAALIERVEQSTGPGRELDALIHFSTHERWAGRPTSWPPTLIRKPDMETGLYMCIEGDGYCFGDTVPAYTASLDAAMMLVPDGFDWRIGRTNGGLTIHAEVGATGEECMRFADTPALALCAAALHAFEDRT